MKVEISCFGYLQRQSLDNRATWPWGTKGSKRFNDIQERENRGGVRISGKLIFLTTNLTNSTVVSRRRIGDLLRKLALGRGIWSISEWNTTCISITRVTLNLIRSFFHVGRAAESLGQIDTLNLLHSLISLGDRAPNSPLSTLPRPSNSLHH